MKSLLRFGLVLVMAASASSCFFEDQSPDTLSFRLSGSPGSQVLAIYSTRFIAGINETGGTEVRVFNSDSVIHTLPIDTTFSIAVDQQFFVQIEPVDTVDVGARVDVDGRNVLSSEGFIFPDTPWRYVYQFNQLLTEIVEVVL